MSLTSPAGASATAPAGLDDGLRARIAEQLAGRFKGDIIGPDHPEYESARQLWNAMVDRRPGLIRAAGPPTWWPRSTRPASTS